MSRQRVVIVGAGFGELACARALREAPVDVTLLDRSVTLLDGRNRPIRLIAAARRRPSVIWTAGTTVAKRGAARPRRRSSPPVTLPISCRGSDRRGPATTSRREIGRASGAASSVVAQHHRRRQSAPPCPAHCELRRGSVAHRSEPRAAVLAVTDAPTDPVEACNVARGAVCSISSVTRAPTRRWSLAAGSRCRRQAGRGGAAFPPRRARFDRRRGL